MKIYISGKITGDPHYNAKFARAAADITDAGHTPINPALQPEGMSNADYMRISFAQLDSADAVAFLPGWEDSKGAQIEHLWVEYTGKPTYDIKSARLSERLRDIDAQPSAHFVHDGPRFAGGVDWWHCSNCGRLASGVETRFDYCPWCGARMDGDDDALD